MQFDDPKNVAMLVTTVYQNAKSDREQYKYVSPRGRIVLHCHIGCHIFII